MPSFAEQLKLARDKLRKTQHSCSEDKFSLPGFTVPQPLEENIKSAKTSGLCKTKEYTSRIASHSIQTCHISFESVSEIKALHRLCVSVQDGGLEPLTIDEASFESDLWGILTRVQVMIDGMVTVESEKMEAVGENESGENEVELPGVVAKLSGFSARDAAVSHPSFFQRYRDERNQHYTTGARSEHSQNVEVMCVLRAVQPLLKAYSAVEVFRQFAESRRIRAKLEEGLSAHGSDCVHEVYLQLQRFMPLDIDMGFRGFVFNGSLTALTQRNHCACFPRLQQLDESIKSHITTFFSGNVQSAMAEANETNYIVDFSIVDAPGNVEAGCSNSEMENVHPANPYSWTVIVTAIHPFSNEISPGLYSWEDDKALLQQGPFSYRFVTCPHPDLNGILDPQCIDAIHEVRNEDSGGMYSQAETAYEEELCQDDDEVKECDHHDQSFDEEMSDHVVCENGEEANDEDEDEDELEDEDEDEDEEEDDNDEEDACE